MAGPSNIEWTERTWNPIVGCKVVSPGCTNCYAMRMAARLTAMGVEQYVGLTQPSKAGPVWNGKMNVVRRALHDPIERKKPTTWFVNSMSDLFAESVDDETILDVFTVMAATPQHTYQVLTKRPERALEWLDPNPDSFRHTERLEDIYANWYGFSGSPAEVQAWPLPNVIIGASVEDQTRANERRRPMADIAELGWRTFVSYEPALGPVDWTGWEFLRWLISGGESGPGARPSHPDWHREARDFCAEHGIPFFFKQWGVWAPGEACPNLNARDAASYFDNRWTMERVPAGSSDMHIDDEPDVYRIGKKAAGRLLDGVTHDAFPNLSLPNGAAPSLPLSGAAQ